MNLKHHYRAYTVRSLTLIVLAAWVCSATAQDQPPHSPITLRPELALAASDRTIAESFIRHAQEFAAKLTSEAVAAKCKKAPEMFAWVEFRYLDCLNTAYELTGDTTYLDTLRDSFELFRAVLSTGADEYLGWYGSPIGARIPKDDPDIQIDEIQMTFRAIGMLSRWVELARENDAYATHNATTIAAYIDLMEQHLFPKWDERGFFAEIKGRGGVYRGLDFPIEGGVTLSHEKLSIMVDGCLKLHRVTGNAVYLTRALQVGAWFKSCLSLKDGHYEWMSWVPAGRWDVSPDKENAWKVGWIAPDPNAGWYVTSLSIALNLYQHGLLFTDEDLQRFVATQKTMCWNGDMDAPEYRTVAGTKNKWVKGRFLSQQLAHYDRTLTKLAFGGPHEAEQLANAGSSWKGGANAQDYVREKYIMAQRIAQNSQPYADIGKRYLEVATRKAVYEQLFSEVTAPGATVPMKPSEMPAR